MFSKIVNYASNNGGFIRRTPVLYAMARAKIEAANSQDGQSAALAKTLTRARQLGAYRNVGGSDLRDFPLTLKSNVRRDPAAYEARLMVPGFAQHTSGTTGAPLRVVRSIDSVVYEQALVDWLVGKSGITLRRARVAVLRGADIKAPDDRGGPFWQRAGKTLTFSSNHLSKETVGAYLGALIDFRPDVVLAYPSVLENLVRLADGSSRRWTCPLAVTSSEVLLPQTRRLMAERLRGDVFDFYGQAERVASAWSIEPEEYFFVPSYGHVELIAEPGSECREIVSTPYHNRAQVLVRYRTGDFIATKAKDAASIAAIARGLAPFQGIAGRQDDVLLWKGGSILVGIDHIPRGLEDLGHFQIIQEDLENVRILVRGAGDQSEKARRRILQRARMKLPGDIAIDIRFVDELHRTQSGKTPFVVREFSRADSDSLL